MAMKQATKDIFNYIKAHDGEDFTVDDLVSIASEDSIELPFPAEKFLKIMMRKSCKC